MFQMAGHTRSKRIRERRADTKSLVSAENRWLVSQSLAVFDDQADLTVTEVVTHVSAGQEDGFVGGAIEKRSDVAR